MRTSTGVLLSHLFVFVYIYAAVVSVVAENITVTEVL